MNKPIHIDLTKKRGAAKDKALTPDERDMLLSNKKEITKEDGSKEILSLLDDKDRIDLILQGLGGLRISESLQTRDTWLSWVTMGDYEVLKIKIPSSDSDTRNLRKKWFNTESNKSDFKTKTRKDRSTYIGVPHGVTGKQDIRDIKLATELYTWFKSNPLGLQMSRQAFQKRIKKHFIPMLGRDNFSSHAMRATAENYWMDELELKPKFCSVCLGHSDIRTTMKHYDTMNTAQQEAYMKGVINRGASK